MKIYTKQGDGGETRLFNNECVAKDSLRVEAYGALDELNSTLGFARALKASKDVDKILNDLQNALFILGSDLATPVDFKTGRKIYRIKESDIRRLERAIDKFEAKLPTLNGFILPGGSLGGAALHMARTVCRRAERITVKLAQKENIGANPIKFLNRLSDLLFVLARTINHNQGVKEIFRTVSGNGK